MRIAILSFTRQGAEQNRKVAEELRKSGLEVACYGFHKYEAEGVQPFTKTALIVAEEFLKADCLLFIGACQIAVRSIVPFVKSKVTDPAVLSMDEMGRYVIPLLSGHLGGANALAKRIADVCGATPVITTATDLHELFAVDVWAKENGLIIAEMELAKEVSAALLEGEAVGFYCAPALKYTCPKGLTEETKSLGICVSYEETKQPFAKTLHLIPKEIVLGIGCRKGKSYEELQEFVEETLVELGISKKSIERIASIDLKKDEPGLCKLSKEWGIPFTTYSAKELTEVTGEFTASSFVAGTTGVDNVCERSAVLASNEGVLIQKKKAKNGMTIAISRRIR